MSEAPSATSPLVVYLGGFGRSGSTLLERVLGAIPGWVNVGELVDLPRSVYPDRERCGCGEPFTECPFWAAVGTEAFGGWDAHTLARLADLRLAVARQRQLPSLLRLARGGGRGSGLARLVEEYQHGYGALYRAAVTVSGCSVVVDASKGPAHGLALGLTVPGAAAREYALTMVNLVRDPRGVAYSWSRRRTDRPQAGSARAQMWSISASRSAAQWAALQSEMGLLGPVAGIPTHRLRYEDLVSEPRGAVTGLLDDLGISMPPDGLAHLEEHAVTLAPSHGLSGNPSRFTHGRIELHADDEWRRAMPKRERRLVTATTIPWLVGYGYPPARRGGSGHARSTRAETP